MTEDFLVNYEIKNPEEFFTPTGIEPFLRAVTVQVEGFVPDTTSAKGRKEIASLANKVARSKVLVDERGKELVAGWKEKAKAVDTSRKMLRDYLDDLKQKIRQPLTEWEKFEELRIADHKKSLESLKHDTNSLRNNLQFMSLEKLVDILYIEKQKINYEAYEEFATEFKFIHEAYLASLEQAISIKQEQIKAKEEQDRKEAEAKKQLELAQAEAKRISEENEKRLAEQRAESKRIEEENKRILSEQKAEQERIQAEHRKANEALEKEKLRLENERVALERQNAELLKRLSEKENPPDPVEPEPIVYDKADAKAPNIVGLDKASGDVITELFESAWVHLELPNNRTVTPKDIARMMFKAGMKAVVDNLPAYKETSAIDSREKFMVFGFNICIDEIREKFKEKIE